jgi:hypothetical protein
LYETGIADNKAPEHLQSIRMTPGLDTYGNQQPWLHKDRLLVEGAPQISYDDDQKSGASSASNCLPATVGAWSANLTMGSASGTASHA